MRTIIVSIQTTMTFKGSAGDDFETPQVIGRLIADYCVGKDVDWSTLKVEVSE